jgi:hypothetical protein
MERRRFLFNLVKAAAAAYIVPSLYSEAHGKPPFITVDVGWNPPRTVIKMFKVSKQLLQDEEMFNMLLDHEKIYEDKQPDHVEVGFTNDDFVKDLYTVKLTYKMHESIKN